MYRETPENMILRDYLALDRTMLANTRTFLAYIRTSIGLLATGTGLIKVFGEGFLAVLGWILLYLSPAMLLFGLWHFLRERRRWSALRKQTEK